MALQPVFHPKPVPKEESRILKSRLQEVRKMSNRVMRDMDAIWHQPGRGRALLDRRRRAWKSNANFVRWLGDKDLTKDQLSDVRRRLRSLDARLFKDVHFHIHRELGGKCEAGVWAWHARGRHVHICPRYFNEAFNEQASTIVHELCHGLGFFGTGHPGMKLATSHTAARKLAGSNPKKARKNPWNFESLFLEYATTPAPIPP